MVKVGEEQRVSPKQARLGVVVVLHSRTDTDARVLWTKIPLLGNLLVLHRVLHYLKCGIVASRGVYPCPPLPPLTFF